ncbi:MAG: hypothetical protein K6B68_16630 [Eubacterium sp.]|nr:hypothetical protein [Eubacterium sp.]
MKKNMFQRIVTFFISLTVIAVITLGVSVTMKNVVNSYSEKITIASEETRIGDTIDTNDNTVVFFEEIRMAA